MNDRLAIARNWNPERLSALRWSLRQSDLSGVVVPRWDKHQSEYCAPHDERLAWATGFSGTWGIGFVTLNEAALFVDGRYTGQAAEEVDSRIERLHLLDEPYESWLGKALGEGDALGYDPLVVNPDMLDRLTRAAIDHGFALVPTDCDPIARVWADRPDAPLIPATPFPISYAGESSVAKRQRLTLAMEEGSIDLLVESQLDNVAWLLNLRGGDVPDNPFVHANIIAGRDGRLDLFVDERKLGNDRTAFELDGVDLHAPDTFGSVLAQRISAAPAGARIVSDGRFSPALAKLAAEAAGASYHPQTSPLTRLKAIKNPVELAGMRSAALRDSSAWVTLLHWLDGNVAVRQAAGNPITEIEVEERLARIRNAMPEYVSPSFRTIAGSGANGAMCHYNAPPEGGATLGQDELFLLDAGAQFRDGTTDTTRTVCFGAAHPEWRRCYTLVLKGHIRLCTIRFPHATQGYQIDAFAREALWAYGLDYDHGTGHGVGHFLSVHEHPQRIGKDALAEPLLPGMTITNEPGYYRAGEFGIRIENLCEIVADNDGFLRLEPMAFVPFSRKLIDADLLDAKEVAWLDWYHAQTWDRLSDLAHDGDQREWLRRATLPIT